MQSRQLGRFDISLSIVGFGGIVIAGCPQSEADATVAEAIDRGVTYFDVAPTYRDAEQRLGPALEPYRNNVTLACKTIERTAAAAQAELEQSLKHLRTDHFDIYQMHGMTTREDFDTAMGPGGAIETFERAKEKGLTKLIGFSAHDEHIALRLIETGRFDTVLFALNYAAYTRGGFGPRLVKHANEKGMGLLALKAMARCRVADGQDKPYAKCWYVPEDRPEIAQLQLRWTLSLPGVTAALPPGDPGLWRMAVDMADELTPLDEVSETELDHAVENATGAPIFGTTAD